RRPAAAPAALRAGGGARPLHQHLGQALALSAPQHRRRPRPLRGPSRERRVHRRPAPGRVAARHGAARRPHRPDAGPAAAARAGALRAARGHGRRAERLVPAGGGRAAGLGVGGPVTKKWRLLGSLTLLAVLAWRLDWGRLASAFARLDVGLWLAALLVYLLTQFVSAVRWQALARLVGFDGGWGRYLAYYYVGMLFNLVLPTSVGGDVVRAWYLARQPGAGPAAGRRTAALLSVLADRA